MKDKEGFTLMELIVVIAILAALTIIAVPAVLGVSNKVKQKLLDSKISNYEQALLLWSQDNRKCFTDGGDDCLTMSCINYDSDTIKCSVSYQNMAEFGLINYDKGTSIVNPVNDKDIKFSSIGISYNTLNNSFDILGTTVSALPVPRFTLPRDGETHTAVSITGFAGEVTTYVTTRFAIIDPPIRPTQPKDTM